MFHSLLQSFQGNTEHKIYTLKLSDGEKEVLNTFTNFLLFNRYNIKLLTATVLLAQFLYITFTRKYFYKSFKIGWKIFPLTLSGVARGKFTLPWKMDNATICYSFHNILSFRHTYFWQFFANPEGVKARLTYFPNNFEKYSLVKSYLKSMKSKSSRVPNWGPRCSKHWANRP